MVMKDWRARAKRQITSDEEQTDVGTAINHFRRI
jgi:hypothetical protein